MWSGALLVVAVQLAAAGQLADWHNARGSLPSGALAAAGQLAEWHSCKQLRDMRNNPVPRCQRTDGPLVQYTI